MGVYAKSKVGLRERRWWKQLQDQEDIGRGLWGWREQRVGILECDEALEKKIQRPGPSWQMRSCQTEEEEGGLEGQEISKWKKIKLLGSGKGQGDTANPFIPHQEVKGSFDLSFQWPVVEVMGDNFRGITKTLKAGSTASRQGPRQKGPAQKLTQK